VAVRGRQRAELSGGARLGSACAKGEFEVASVPTIGRTVPAFRRPERVGLIGAHVDRSRSAGGFARSLRDALLDLPSGLDCRTILVGEGGREPGASLILNPEHPRGFRRAADYLNFAGVDAVSVQHDFEGFAGSAGERLIELLPLLRAPVVTTLHEVPTHPEPQQERVLRQLAKGSARVVVLARKAAEVLEDTYDVDPDAIEVVPCGVHERASLSDAAAKARLGLGGRRVLMTVGLLAPDKGIEVMIEALPAIVAAHPELVYAIVGETHPALVAREGESYRQSLVDLAKQRGVARHVRLIEAHPEGDDLCATLAAADLYLSPYLSEAEMASHTLASAFALGKPVVATPFWYARELLGEDRGALVAFGSPQALADQVLGLLSDPRKLASVSRRALAAGREMLWPKVARRYEALFAAAMREARPALAYPRNARSIGSAVTG
jgi:glycosyltransferase involved in cell wall biosynthesis